MPRSCALLLERVMTIFSEEAAATNRDDLRRLPSKDCCEAPNGLLPCLSY